MVGWKGEGLVLLPPPPPATWAGMAEAGEEVGKGWWKCIECELEW